MTNNEIIYSEVNAKYHTPEQRRAILALAYTPEQIAAKGKEIHFKDVPEEQQGEELEKLLLAGLSTRSTNGRSAARASRPARRPRLIPGFGSWTPAPARPAAAARSRTR